MLFDDEFSTVPFIREGKIPPNCTDLVQRISQSSSPYNVYLKDSWFNPEPEEAPSETSSHESSVAPENTNNILMLSQSIRHRQESPENKGASVSEVIERPASGGV